MGEKGGKGKRFSGTTIKVTWTKQRGGWIREEGGDCWGEGEWWGKMQTTVLEHVYIK